MRDNKYNNNFIKLYKLFNHSSLIKCYFLITQETPTSTIKLLHILTQTYKKLNKNTITAEKPLFVQVYRSHDLFLNNNSLYNVYLGLIVQYY